MMYFAVKGISGLKTAEKVKAKKTLVDNPPMPDPKGRHRARVSFGMTGGV
jgi:hypothetical protein